MTDYDADLFYDEQLYPYDGLMEILSQENPFYFGLPGEMVTPKVGRSKAFVHAYEHGRLKLTFPNGKSYTYRVSEDLYRRFMSADSKGRFFHEYLKHLDFS
jgi:hypothetical protein